MKKKRKILCSAEINMRNAVEFKGGGEKRLNFNA